ncbi:DUF2917 domain-containing protein [Undibacterium sp.]|jgi:quercetin dioxygenase-like cupin family protein|uniref:DUF2917 domain-containing protein n=1 Tax=Undibacterium sp. TaxID=1914977 RepID=UPI002CDFED53|nr:DUF2917 domain-containing protein [Undibacterium sp.]HTD05978.1 DUF2917 domain-containing protein [Undibacterium sp.]
MLVKFAKESYTIPAGAAVSGKVSRPHAIHVASGRVWLTVEGWSADHWLNAGDSFTLPADRLVVIEADKQASLIEAAGSKSLATPAHLPKRNAAPRLGAGKAQTA